jgi:hypothetical protein
MPYIKGVNLSTNALQARWSLDEHLATSSDRLGLEYSSSVAGAVTHITQSEE